jgi:hypothetical protein
VSGDSLIHFYCRSSFLFLSIPSHSLPSPCRPLLPNPPPMMLLCARRKMPTLKLPFVLAEQTISLLSKKRVSHVLVFSIFPCLHSYSSILRIPVTNLESVVLQLQESCREAKTESTELRQENTRLRHTVREREKFWHTIWSQSRKANNHSGSHSDDFPPQLPPAYPSSVPSNGASLASPISPTHINQYSDQALSTRYPSNRDPSGSMTTNAAFNPGTGQDFPNRSPTITFASADGEHGSIDGRSNSMQSQRVTKYNNYAAYDVEGHVRDPTWTQNMTQAPIPGSDPMHQDSGSSSHSPGFVESSSNLTSPEMSYMQRYPVEDQKMPLTNLDTAAPYVFSNSRPLSPSASTTSSSSSTMTSPFQFPFSDGSVPQERPDFNFRRHSSGTGAELTLHGGTAHISLMGENDRYRIPGGRRTNNGSEAQPFPVMTPLSAENPSHERDNSEGEAVPYYHGSQPPTRRSTATSRTSRSPSPGTQPICGTLAVIKAQAFGALRRTRTRTKKGSEGAAKAALEALEARGIGVGMSLPKSNKRPRLDDDDDDDGDFRP